MEPCSSSFLTSVLRDVDGNLIRKKKINVYHGQDDYLTMFKTNPDGSFRVEIPNKSKSFQVELLFRLIGENKFKCPTTKVTIQKVRHEKEEVIFPFTFGIKEVEYAGIRMETAFADEKVPLSYFLDVAKAGGPALIRGTAVNSETIIFREDRVEAIKEMQKSYGVKSIPLTDKNIWGLLTNGICPIFFRKEKDGTLSAEFNWDTYLFSKPGLPNTKAYFSGWQGAHPEPKIEKIEVQYRNGLNPPKSWKDMQLKTTHYPIDHDFDKMKLKFNNGAFIMGQIVFHLGWGHVYGARIAQLVYDHLQGTKLGDYLIEHCKLIRKITNDLGAQAITGKDGILARSPVSTDGTLHGLARGVGALNPFTSRPRKAMNEDHVFAKDSNEFYDSTFERTKNFNNENWEVTSTKDWAKISAFFGEVHSGSPFYHQWESENVPMDEWLDANEIGGIKDERVPERTKSDESDPQVRSIPLIAKNVSGPEKFDKEMIELFVTDYIHRVTYWHSAVHRSQYAESDHFPNSKDVGFTPISLEGDGEDEFGGIKVEDVLEQQEIAGIFQNFPVDHYAVTNPNSAVDSGLVERFKDLEGKVSIPLNEVAYSTVI